MLYQLGLYLLISFICMWSGALFYAYFPLGKTAFSLPAKRSFILYLLTGLMVITCFAQWWVLFLPLNQLAEIALLVLLLTGTLLSKSRFSYSLRCIDINVKKKGIAITGLAVLLLMILTINAGPSMMDDTESYHIQMIKWAQEYGTVPGLANLHFRYGFNSSWFISAGILCPAWTSGDHYLTLNGLVSCWLVVYLVMKIMEALPAEAAVQQKRTAIAALLVLIAGIVVWPMIRGNAATANYDFITTCCIIVLFMEVMAAAEYRPGPEWIWWPLYLFTVRIINFPLLGLMIYPLWQNRMVIKRMLFFAAATGLLFLLPFFARNLLLSGYLFYPAPALDVFSFDWKADKPEMIRTMRFIKYFNRVNNMYLDIDETSRLRFPYWIKAWYHYLFRYDKLLFSVSLASYAAAAAILAANRFRMAGRAAIFFMGVMLVQLLAWFLIGPDPRFVYGPLLCGVILLIFCLPARVTRPWGLMAGAGFACLIIFVAGYTVHKWAVDSRYHNMVFTRPLPQPAVQRVVVGGIELCLPEKIEGNWNARCYDLCLPCLYRIDPRLRPRGKHISDGFRLEQPDMTKQSVYAR